MLSARGAFGRRHEEMQAPDGAALVGYDGKTMPGGHGGDAADLGHPAAPVDVGLQDVGSFVVEQMLEAPAGVLMLGRSR